MKELPAVYSSLAVVKEEPFPHFFPLQFWHLVFQGLSEASRVSGKKMKCKSERHLASNDANFPLLQNLHSTHIMSLCFQLLRLWSCYGKTKLLYKLTSKIFLRREFDYYSRVIKILQLLEII